MELGDLAAVTNGDAVAVELGEQVVGHRLAQVGPPMKKRHQGAAAGKPNRRLSRGVAAAHHSYPGACAGPGLRRAGGVEDGQALELLEAACTGRRR